MEQLWASLQSGEADGGAFRQKRLGISFLDILSVGKKLLSEGEPSVNQSRFPEELVDKLKFRIQNR